MRLLGGFTYYEGTVEICVNHAWGTISDSYGWGYEEAQTVCNALGYFAPGICSYICNINITIHIKLKGHQASQMLILEKGLVQLLLTMWIVQQ